MAKFPAYLSIGIESARKDALWQNIGQASRKRRAGASDFFADKPEFGS